MGSKIKILIVDDIEDNLTILVRRLKKIGYSTFTATDGQEAFELAKKEKPDLILMDLRMPKVNGWTSLKMLKMTAETKNIPTVAVSAEINKNDAEKLAKAGFTDWVEKPIKAKKLVEKIDEWLKVKDDNCEIDEAELKRIEEVF